jgi:hypothetical protein
MVNSTPLAPATSGIIDHMRLRDTFTCGGCDATWTGLSVAHCGSCHVTLSGAKLFDQHRRPDRAHGMCLAPAVLRVKAQPCELRGGVWHVAGMDDAALARVRAGTPRRASGTDPG